MLTLYGLPVLFGATFLNSTGIPIPTNILLIAAGSFIELGDMNLWWVILLCSIGAILGDQVDYLIGVWGGRSLVIRLNRWPEGQKRLKQVTAFIEKWGGISIFMSRWLITVLGSWVSLASGISGFSYPIFLFWDALGEIVWVGIFVMIGVEFSDRIQTMINFIGNLAWVEIGLLGAIIFGWILLKNHRTARI